MLRTLISRVPLQSVSRLQTHIFGAETSAALELQAQQTAGRTAQAATGAVLEASVNNSPSYSAPAVLPQQKTSTSFLLHNPSSHTPHHQHHLLPPISDPASQRYFSTDTSGLTSPPPHTHPTHPPYPASQSPGTAVSTAAGSQQPAASPKQLVKTLQRLSQYKSRRADAPANASKAAAALLADGAAALHSLGPSQLSRAALSLAALQHAHSSTWRAIAQHSLMQLPACDAKQLVSLAYALATAGAASSEWLQAAGERLSALQQQLTPRYIATMLYAMARAGAAPEAALAPLLASTKAQLPAFSGQQVANSLWALASLGRRDDELLALVARLMSAPHRPHASPQEVATIAWSYAQLGRQEPLLMVWLAMEVSSSSRGLNPQDVANLAWAFAKLGHYNPAVLDDLAAAALRFLGDGSSSKWGTGGAGSEGSSAGSGSDSCGESSADEDTAGSPSKDSSSSGSSSSRRSRASSFSPQGLSNLLWAFAKLAHHHAPLLEAACSALGPLLPRCSVRDLQHCVWALAVLNHYNAVLADKLAARVAALQAAAAVGQAPRFSAIWWGLAVLGQQDPAVFRGAAKLLSEARPQQFGADEMCQLMQVHTILQDTAQERGALPGSALLPPLLPPPLHAACRRAWVHKAWSCVTISHFQRELAQALAAMGLAPRLEYATDDGLFLVDVAVQKGRLRFAIEADGPQHFSRNPPHGPLGHSSARWRCLRARGWYVVSVRLSAWSRLQSDADKRAQLAAALQAAVHSASGIVVADEQPLPGSSAGKVPLPGSLAKRSAPDQWEVVKILNWNNWVI